MNKHIIIFKRINKTILVLAGITFLASLILFCMPVKTQAQSLPQAEAVQTASTVPANSNNVTGWAFLSAALATGLACIGAGIAVSNVGAAAMGAVTERPELMGKSLIYVALAEGIAIYGLLISIIVLARI